MSTPAAATGSDSPKLRDGTTRFLCGAARPRCKVRDSALPALALVPLFAGSGMLLAVWQPLGKRAPRASPHARAPLVLGTATGTGTGTLLFALHKFTGEPYASGRYSSSYYEEYEPGSGGGALVVAIIAISSNIATAGKARTVTVEISTAEESR